MLGSGERAEGELISGVRVAGSIGGPEIYGV